MPTNTAAWIAGPRATPLEVREAPFPIPGHGDVIVQNAYIAINPLEFKIQDHNSPIAGKPLQYPTILGADLSGTIVETGADVKEYKVGDRIMANAVGAATGRPHMSAFQAYTQLSAASLTRLPDEISLEKGAVLPLACDTAMAGLFTANQLALSTAHFFKKSASASASTPPQDGDVLLVWGGSSSVGCSAIQLARAAGYAVYTTASTRNHALCGELGATRVFDYADASVEAQIIGALAGKQCVGAIDCIADAERTIPACARILARAEGRRNKKVVTVLTPPEERFAEGVEVMRLSIPALRQSSVYGIVHDWMPRGLQDGSLRPKPDPLVIGEGLEFVQQGLDMVRKGVSATKVIVKLPGIKDVGWN